MSMNVNKRLVNGIINKYWTLISSIPLMEKYTL